MNEYLLDPSPQLLERLRQEQSGFDGATVDLAAGTTEQKLIVLSRRANAAFLTTFERNRQIAGRGRVIELPAVKALNEAEGGVLRPLDAAQDVFLHEVAQRRVARSGSDFEALLAALLAALIGIGATVSLGVYSSRLLGGMARRRSADRKTNALESEYTSMLQGAATEEEADELLKRQVERTLVSSKVVVLRRNNSDDRLEVTHELEPQFAERLLDADPRSCLAIRFGQAHEESEQHEPLIRCPVCATDDGFSTCQPLLVGGEVIGAALVHHASPLSDPERTAFFAAVSHAGPVLANLRNLALARFRAATDALTGLPNSREVQDTLKRMTAHASRTVSPLTALLIDLDHFKQVNDSYGHAIGDDVLAAFGSTVQATLRASDFVGRYGGEEFVVLLPDTGVEEAQIVAEKIKGAIAGISVPGVARPITASIGLATLPDHAGDSAILLRCADRALYTAKAKGRNRVEVSHQPDDVTSGDVRVS